MYLGGVARGCSGVNDEVVCAHCVRVGSSGSGVVLLVVGLWVCDLVEIIGAQLGGWVGECSSGLPMFLLLMFLFHMFLLRMFLLRMFLLRIFLLHSFLFPPGHREGCGYLMVMNGNTQMVRWGVVRMYERRGCTKGVVDGVLVS